MRPSDHARERAAQALREHFADGRLDARELERRVGIAYAARSRAELKSLFRDLPWDPRSRDRAERFWRFQQNVLRAHAAAFAGVNGLLVGIWALAGQGAFWPGASIAGWGGALGLHWALLHAWRKSRRERAERRRLPPAARRTITR